MTNNKRQKLSFNETFKRTTIFINEVESDVCRSLLKFEAGFTVFAIFQDELEARISFKAFFLQPIG